MKFTEFEIKNFKAIKDARIRPHDVMTILVGANGSGKSSVLQSIHWMLQSARNTSVKPTSTASKASTLAERDALYMPADSYVSAGHQKDYGNYQHKPQLDLVAKALDGNGDVHEASMWLKSARNSGLSVHVPAGNAITSAVRENRREVSAYIPGLSGIPLAEEWRADRVVRQLAAGGDSNTVLRNILFLLTDMPVGNVKAIDVLQDLVSDVLGPFSLKVNFGKRSDVHLQASFQAGPMVGKAGMPYRPLELVGIGYLQVIQIFAYLLLFNPRLLLVDEPDSHLYPAAQEKLVEVLYRVAKERNTQVIMTTHSPTIVRAVPQDSNVVWMKDGVVEAASSERIRSMMGWGLLDKKVVLITEDEKSASLKALLRQWPELDRATAVWPVHGADALPGAGALEEFRSLLGGSANILLHRDADFMMPLEAKRMQDKFDGTDGVELWITSASDLESYWCDARVIAAHFGVDDSVADALLKDAVARCVANDAHLVVMRRKRADFDQKHNRSSGSSTIPRYGDADVVGEYERRGYQHVVKGKTLMKAIRSVASGRGLSLAGSFSEEVPKDVYGNMALDLRDALFSVCP